MKMSTIYPSNISLMGIYLFAVMSMISTTITLRSYGFLNYLVYELALTEIFVIGMVALTFPTVIRTLVSRHSGIGQRYLLLYCLGIFLTLVGSLLFNDSSNYNFEESLGFFRRAFVSSLLIFLMVQGQVKKIVQAQRIILIVLGIGIVVGIFIITGSYVLDIRQNVEEGIRVGMINLPAGMTISVGGSTMALYFLVILLAGWSMTINCRGYLLLFGLVTFSVSLIVLVLLVSRGVIIIAIPALFLVTFLSMKTAKKKTIVTLLLVCCLVSLTAPVVLEKTINYLGSYQIKRLEALQENRLEKHETLLVRLQQFEEYLPLIIMNPWGYGYLERYDVKTIPQPESLYLRVGLYSGILGFIGYFGFLIVNMKFWLGNIKIINEEYIWAPIAAFVSVGCIVCMGWGYSFFHRPHLNLPFMIFIVSTSVLCRLARKDTIKKTGLVKNFPS